MANLFDLKQYRCKTCGEPLDISKAVGGVIKCAVCDSCFTLPKVDASQKVLDFLSQGEHDLDTGRFEDAYSAFNKVTELDKTEPEAYWGMALAEFKIQYLKDEVNNRLQPICHEISDNDFADSSNFLKALRYATDAQRTEYEKKSEEINYIKNEFYKIAKTGVKYDCFICVKVSAEDGNKTQDYKTADDIYFELKGKGYKPFFSERELVGVTGADYEARILYALKSSECMLVVCLDEAYLRTKWVKNEYSRFLKLVNDEEKESDSIALVFGDRPIEKLPGKKGKIQGIALNSLTAMERIVSFVDSHTPEARKRMEEALRKKEEEAKRKAQEDDEQRKRFAEQEEQLRQQAELIRKLQEQMQNQPQAQTTGGLSDEELFERMERARQERERKQREREETERKAREERERIEREKREAEERGLRESAMSEGVKCPICKADLPIDSSKNGIVECRICGERVSLKQEIENIRIRAEKERQERERKERERKETEERARLERERIEREKREAEERARLQAEKERQEKERIERERKEAEERARLQAEKERQEKERQQAEWLALGFEIKEGRLIKYKGTVTEVVIPDGVTSIEKNAFKRCNQITRVIIPKTVTSIGGEFLGGAFQECSALTSVTIPESVTHIGRYAFYKCSELKHLTIPNSVTEIGDCAFEDCNGLIQKEYGLHYVDRWVVGRDIEIPEANIIKDIVLRSDTIGIAMSALESYKELRSLKIPNGVKYICFNAFRECVSLTSVNIPTGMTNIGPQTFSGCTGLTEITIPNTITAIERYAFNSCWSLKFISIPDNVTSIGDCAFDSCRGLKSVTISNSVTNIAESAFADCGALESITVAADNLNYKSVNNCLLTKDGKTLIRGNNSGFIPDGVTKIGASAFDGCSSLKSVTIPNSVTTIGGSSFSMRGAFRGCTGLTTITIPNGVTGIGDYMFKGCTGLKSITVPNSVTRIGHEAFADCTELTNFTIPESVKEIVNLAFTDCIKLKSIHIPSKVRNIYWAAFSDCGGLESITVAPDNSNYKSVNNCLLTKDGKTLIRGCNSSIIPDGVTEIDTRAFSGCTTLKSIVVPNSVKKIGEDAFSRCKALTSITLPFIGCSETEKTSLLYLFNDYSSEDTGRVPASLTAVELSEGATKISERALVNCSALKKFIIPNSVTEIGKDAFLGATNLTIYCRAKKQPESWNKDWDVKEKKELANYKTKLVKHKVKWKYKGE